MAMQRYVIEREIPGASQMTQEQLRDASGHSNKVLAEMGEGIRWDHSYVAGDKIYCVYDAEDESLIRRHAEASGFPAPPDWTRCGCFRSTRTDGSSTG